MKPVDEQAIDKFIEKAKIASLKVADKIPLPLHYILNGLFIIFMLGDLAVLDPIPFLDEILGLAGLYYYNAYILKRTFGVLNPMRILRGESPAAKRRLGLLPYEDQMDRIRDRLKAMRKAAKSSEVPGLSIDKVKKLTDQVKQIEKRLLQLDRILTRPEFQEGRIKSEIARIQARLDAVDEDELKVEYRKAIEHAGNHIENIDRLRDERNRLVARLERFNLQLDNIYSQLMAATVPLAEEPAAARLFDELFDTVNTFDETLKELEQKPSKDLYEAAVKEIEQTEEKFKAKVPTGDTSKTI
jgi:hypothetical protein